MTHDSGQKFTERKHFFRSVGILASGTAGAQLILLLCLPIITRIYSPDEFGVFAVYTAWVSMLSIAASMRFEIALPLPEEDDDAAGLLLISVASILFFSTLVAVFGSLYPGVYSQSLNTEQLGILVWAVPVGVLITSIYSVLQYWASRKRRYRLTANIKVTQSAIETTSQIGSGVSGMVSLGLVAGQVFGRLVAVILLGNSAFRDILSIRLSFTWMRTKSLVYQYRRFPLLSTPDSLINSASLQAPIILIAIFVDASTAGILFMAVRILQLPIGLMANAISQVYLTELPAYIRQGKDSAITTQVMKNLTDLAVGPIIFVTMTAHNFLSFFLGEQWAAAGSLMAWMAPWMILLMQVSPISVILQAKDLSHVSLLVNFFGFSIRCIPIVILGWKELDAYIPQAFALSSALFYLVRLSVCMRFANVNAKEVFFRRKSICILFAWLVAGISLRSLF